MSVSNFLLMHVFTALLPSPDAVDYEYYECLGISKHSSLEDIRKGYKKKSLELHPDKIAQRGKVDAATAAAQYERVQEASSVLQDKSKRKQYQGLGCSVARYRFLVSGGIYNPGAIMENLQHASFLNKTRLVLIVSIFFTIMLLQPILIAAKVNAVVDKNASDTDTDNMSMNMNMNTDDNNDSILQDTAWTII
jgi:preprotein translocase subunit Sec63